MRRLVLLFALLAAIVTPAVSLFAQSNDTTAASAAIAWIRANQQADGGFPGFGPGDSADVTLAFAAAGIDPIGIVTNGNSPIAYLGTKAAGYATKSVGATAKLILAVVAAGKDPRAFGGLDLAAQLGATYDARTGQYGVDSFGHALALLAIRSMGATPPAAALARLTALQLADGGWSFDGSVATGSDTNTSSLALQALVANAGAADAISKGVAYLKSQQNADGGFPYSKSSPYGTDSDANSTANVLQAIAAVGQNPRDAAWTKTGNPLSALLALQNSSGAVRSQAAQPADNALATYQAVPGLLGKALPIVTANVAGAQAVIAPAAAPASVLPKTGEADSTANWLLGLALTLIGGAFMLAYRVRRTSYEAV